MVIRAHNNKVRPIDFTGLLIIYFQNFAIECKRYKERKDNWPITKWWEQTVAAAGDKYIPILIYKYDRQEIKSVIPLSYLHPDLKEKIIDITHQ